MHWNNLNSCSPASYVHVFYVTAQLHWHAEVLHFIVCLNDMGRTCDRRFILYWDERMTQQSQMSFPAETEYCYHGILTQCWSVVVQRVHQSPECWKIANCIFSNLASIPMGPPAVRRPFYLVSMRVFTCLRTSSVKLPCGSPPGVALERVMCLVICQQIMWQITGPTSQICLCIFAFSKKPKNQKQLLTAPSAAPLKQVEAQRWSLDL